MTANVGTVQWMAPEVLTGKPYTESADIFSLGVVVWEVLTGRCPYEGVAPVSVAMSVCQRNCRPDIPGICTAQQKAMLEVRQTLPLLVKTDPGKVFKPSRPPCGLGMLGGKS
jgi:serine/threonine protein kinase